MGPISPFTWTQRLGWLKVSPLWNLFSKSVVFRGWKLSFGFSRQLYWDRSVSFHLETLYSLLRSPWPSAVGYGSVVPHRWVVCCSSWNPVISIATRLLPYPVPSCPSPPPLSPSFPLSPHTSLLDVMSIVITLGVTTPETSYSDMAAGSEWVLPADQRGVHGGKHWLPVTEGFP